MSDRPNIIYILGDDHRAEQLGCMGNTMVQTPNIDAMAADGVTFSNGFCTSPCCTPSRCCHYLGQWERRHGINFNSGTSVAPEAWEDSFPLRLKAEGYFIGWVGKNHVPAGEGGYASTYIEDSFDYWYGNHQVSGFYPKEQSALGGEIYLNSQFETQVEIFEEGAMNFLEPTRGFIEASNPPLPRRPEDKPFCLCVTFNLPHDWATCNMQLRPTDDDIYKSLYRDRFNEVPLPDTYITYQEMTDPKIPLDVYNGIHHHIYDYVRMPSTLRERRIREYQTITGMDRMLGHLRAKLEALGLADNTIIVFSTDHGLHHGEHGLGGKCLLYEEDLRIPLIIYDPRLPEAQRGQVRDELVVAPDLAPTVLDLMIVDIPDAMQGSSLSPLMSAEDVEWREDFFAEQQLDAQNYPRSETVRNRDWKYIRYFKRTEDPRAKGNFRGTLDNYIACLSSTITHEQPVYEELYNLREDPGEVYNLVADRACDTILNEMRARILVLAREARGDDRPPLVLPISSADHLKAKFRPCYRQ